MRHDSRLHFLGLSLLALGLMVILSACGADAVRVALSGATPTPTLTPTPTITPTPTSTPPPTITPTPIPPLFLPAEDPPTPTPNPNAGKKTPAAGECTLRILFMSDVTVPDDMEIQPGAAFIKTWRLKNAGTCPWIPEYRLVFVGGDQMGGPDAQPLGQRVKPGALVDVSVKLTAPTQPGEYTSEWMLETPEGERFGLGDDGQTPFWVKIVVK